jgi:hypothetical protein
MNHITATPQEQARIGNHSKWVFFNIKRAHKAINDLGQQLAAVGQPQEDWKSLYLKDSNIEFARRRELLAAAISGPAEAISAKPVVSHAEPSLPVTLPTIAVQAGANPVLDVPLGKGNQTGTMNRGMAPASDIDRCARARHAMRVYNIAYDGSEPPEVLEARAAAAKVAYDAKAKADDEAWKQYLAERTAHPEPSGPLNATSFAALIDQRRGPGFAKQLAQQVSYVDCSRDGLVAQMAQHQPLTHGWYIAKDKLEKHLRANATIEGGPKEEARKFEVFRRYAASQGWNIPGLDLRGCPAAIDPEASARPKQMASDNAAIAEFVKVLAGDVDAGRSVHPAAEAARKFISNATRKPFVLGLTLNPKL